MSAPLLRAETPQGWLATHLDPLLRKHDAPGFVESTRVWRSRADVLADDAAVLRAEHARVMAEDGAPAVAAAKWVTDWYAGRLASAVGYLYAYGSATAVVDPDRVRFGLHPDGWVQLVDLGDPLIVVLADHPWAGYDGVRVAADDAELARLLIDSVRTLGEPIVEAARGLAKVGRNALWAEVADALGMSIVHDLDSPVDGTLAARIVAALRSPAAPWRTHPEVWLIEHRGVPTYVGRKGGCCLAYQCAPPTATTASEVPSDAREQAWLARFPTVAGEPDYCSTCSLRDVDGCVERQLFWRDQELTGRARPDQSTKDQS